MKLAIYPAVPGSAIGYMPIAAATRGTLSTIEDSNPSTIEIRYVLCTSLSSQPATDPRIPVDCSTATAMSIPRKKRIDGMSMREMTWGTRCSSAFSSILWLYMISVKIHNKLSTKRIPIKGGRCVMDLNMGTKMSPPTPRKKIVFFSRGEMKSLRVTMRFPSGNSPLSLRVASSKGMSSATMLGSNT